MYSLGGRPGLKRRGSKTRRSSIMAEANAASTVAPLGIVVARLVPRATVQSVRAMRGICPGEHFPCAAVMIAARGTDGLQTRRWRESASNHRSLPYDHDTNWLEDGT